MLIGNRSVLLKSFNKLLTGQIATYRSNFYIKTIPLNANVYYSRKAKAYDYFLPIINGGMISHNEASGNTIVTANGAMGFNIIGTSEGSSLAEAIGQLIASAIGTASGSSEMSGTIKAVLAAIGTASGSSSANALINAIAHCYGQANGSSTASLVPYATGMLSGSTAIITEEIDPNTIANAVWNNSTAETIIKLLGNKITKSGNIITIYNDNGSEFRQYDLSDGGRNPL